MLVAVDTNVLLDHANGEEQVPESLEILTTRLRVEYFLVPPTVLQELARQVDFGDTSESRSAALKAVTSLRAWGYTPINLVPAGHGVVEQIGLKLRMLAVIPEEEVNDSLIVAEAALLGCAILLSSDGELREANNNPRFRKCLEDSHAEGCDLTIASPKVIATKFGLKR